MALGEIIPPAEILRGVSFEQITRKWDSALQRYGIESVASLVGADPQTVLNDINARILEQSSSPNRQARFPMDDYSHMVIPIATHDRLHLEWQADPEGVVITRHSELKGPVVENISVTFGTTGEVNLEDDWTFEGITHSYRLELSGDLKPLTMEETTKKRGWKFSLARDQSTGEVKGHVDYTCYPTPEPVSRKFRTEIRVVRGEVIVDMNKEMGQLARPGLVTEFEIIPMDSGYAVCATGQQGLNWPDREIYLIAQTLNNPDHIHFWKYLN